MKTEVSKKYNALLFESVPYFAIFLVVRFVFDVFDFLGFIIGVVIGDDGFSWRASNAEKMDSSEKILLKVEFSCVPGFLNITGTFAGFSSFLFLLFLFILFLKRYNIFILTDYL